MTNIHHSTTIRLDAKSQLYSYVLTNTVSLEIPSTEQGFSVEFTPAQLPLLEQVISDLKLLRKRQNSKQIEKLMSEIQEIKEEEVQEHSFSFGNGNCTTDYSQRAS